MLKLNNRLLALNKCNKRLLHSLYNPSNKALLKLKSLRTLPSFFNDKNFNINHFRFTGIKMSLSYYDSHKYNEKVLKYDYTTTPTVLLLISSEYSIHIHAC